MNDEREMDELVAANLDSLIESLGDDPEELARQVRHLEALERRRHFFVIEGGKRGPKK